MNTSYQSIDELLDHVTNNTDKIIDTITENNVEPGNKNDIEKFLLEMVELGFLRIAGQDEAGNNLYEAI
jgi:hypothetical protein|tara:strand:+ start:347 stop:553 length:207 start_codon:yes stop_codon:yes gene_type:complete